MGLGDIPGEDAALVRGLVLDVEADVVLRVARGVHGGHVERAELERVLVLELREPGAGDSALGSLCLSFSRGV